MSKFPLLDSLSKDINNKDLSYAQKNTFIERIDKIDKEGHELIYALISIKNPYFGYIRALNFVYFQGI